MRPWLLLAGLLGLAGAGARARADSIVVPELNLRLEGLADLRLVHPSGQESYLDGGLGKLRWGSDRHEALRPELGGAYLRGIVGVTPEITLVADVRADTQQQNAVDLIDAYVRWRPVSTTRWRWSVKGGAFFVPVSLENTGIGWISEWTLTPSAINSWVGDELRTIGGEVSLEWRGDVDRIQVLASVYGWNQPAGVALADRGWTFDDHPTGLFDRLRLPDAVARQFTPPGRPAGALTTKEFVQIDCSPGWYAGVAWERPDLGRLALLRYDNEANPAAFSGQFAWRTKFWSLGYATDVPTMLGDVVVLAQGMVGSTAIAPAPAVVNTTSFWAAYALAGIDRGGWRYALRVDRFAADGSRPAPAASHEHGTGVTAAVTWSPLGWLQVVGEVLVADYWRSQRAQEGRAPHVTETQAQLALRVSF
ncbi:MAG: hypothetical protein WDN25_26420 [Acetobacteraceae bacterium]